MLHDPIMRTIFSVVIHLCSVSSCFLITQSGLNCATNILIKMRQKTYAAQLTENLLSFPPKTMAKFLFVGKDKVIKMDWKWKSRRWSFSSLWEEGRVGSISHKHNLGKYYRKKGKPVKSWDRQEGCGRRFLFYSGF